MKKDVTVIIPNWNGRELLSQCLTSLRQQTYTDFTVCVVDNGSTDGSVEEVKATFPEVHVIALSQNVGFAKAINIGLKGTKGKYVALLNNDTKTDPDWLRFLKVGIESSLSVAGCASKMLNYYDPNFIDGCGDVINIVGQGRARGQGKRDRGQYSNREEVFSVCAGAALYRREIFEKVGFFDEDFFAYFEDLDWSFRAQLAGFKFLYVPDALVYHVHGATANRNKRFRHYLEFRNMTQMIIKDMPLCLLVKRWRFVKIPLVHARTIHYFCKKGMAKEALRVEWYIFRHFFHLLKKRAEVQKNRQVSCQVLDQKMEEKRIRLWKWHL